jgi:hypothetical protein
MPKYIVYFHERGEKGNRSILVEDISGNRIRERFRKEQPHLVILDVKMYSKGIKCQ